MNMPFRARLRPYLPLSVICVAFALAVVFVNPLREGGMMDDWAYALSVRNLLQTGVNAPYIWFPTAFPAHTYWGGLFSLVLGYSFASLRISTLMLTLGGLIALYVLAQEHGLGRWQSALICLVFLSSPLVMQFSFNFMTDMPFTAWVVIALALATRGLRIRNTPLMALGGLAGAAAALTRFTGVAFGLGLALTWVFDPERRPKAKLYLAGLILPALATGLMVNTMLLQPAGDTQLSVSQQAGYLSQIGTLALTANWRVAATLEYMALFALPLVLLAIPAAVVGVLRRPTEDADQGVGRLPLPILIGAVVYIAVTLLYGSLGLGLAVKLPLLQGDPSFFRRFVQPPELFSAVTALAAALLAAVVAARHIPYPGAPKLTPHERLIDLVTLFLLGSIALLFQIIDRYVIVIVPYALIVVGVYLQRRVSLKWPWVVAAAATALVLVASAAWTRWYLARNEAQWNASEALAASGINPDEVASTWEWNSYHGDYEIYREQRKRASATYGDYILRWLPKYLSATQYIVTPRQEDVSETDWEIMRDVPYEHWLFPERPVVVFKRISH